MTTSIGRYFAALVVAFGLAGLAAAPMADARGGGGGHAGGGGGGNRQVNNSQRDVRTNNVRSTSVNNVNKTNVNVNRDVNVNVDVDHHGCCGGWDDDYHPVATAAAVTAAVAVTSAVVGSVVRTVPTGCVPVNYGGMIYQQCGATWYQPQGTQYVVINPPY